MTLLLTGVALVGIVGSDGAAALGQSSPSSSDWTSFLDGPAHSSYNAAATSITPTNISDLNPIWRWILPPSTVVASSAINASPTVDDGVIYVGSKDGAVLRLLRKDQEGDLVPVHGYRLRVPGLHLYRHGGR